MPGEFHGQRSLAGHNPWESQTTGHHRATNTFTFIERKREYKIDWKARIRVRKGKEREKLKFCFCRFRRTLADRNVLGVVQPPTCCAF